MMPLMGKRNININPITIAPQGPYRPGKNEKKQTNESSL